MKTKNTKTNLMIPTFEISTELVPLLAGMVSRNWSTNISKNNVKTITVTFQVAHATEKIGKVEG